MLRLNRIFVPVLVLSITSVASPSTKDKLPRRQFEELISGVIVNDLQPTFAPSVTLVQVTRQPSGDDSEKYSLVRKDLKLNNWRDRKTLRTALEFGFHTPTLKGEWRTESSKVLPLPMNGFNYRISSA
jgi:hypothetical protein